jgi:predicted alpha/beta superfamily hydrolase
MRIFIIAMLSMMSLHAQAQPKITLQLELPLHNSVQPFYMASNLNGWNPKDSAYMFRLNGNGKWQLQLPLIKQDLVEYKITKGSWDGVEGNKQGNPIPNRYLTNKNIFGDTTLIVSVAAWSDDQKREKVSTASKNVHVLSDGFAFKALSVQKRVWIYLPEGYAQSKKRYPVLYMHDGQNVFDDLTAAFGEWGVDECLDTLMRELKFEFIVVAVDHGAANRLSEYSPYDFTVSPDSVSQWHAKGKGKLYLDGLVNDLKPYVDANYRTKPGRKSTFIAGSSMGGLISYYAMMYYPSIFSKAGVFSPAFWTVKEKVIEDTKNNAGTWYGSLFMLSGQLEGPRYQRDMMDVYTILKEQQKANVYVEVDPKGQHNEAFWRRRFPDFVLWMSGR